MQCLGPAAIVVEGHRVEIDAPIPRIAHDEARRQLGFDHGEAEKRERVLRRFRIGERNDAIQVVVRPRLLPDQRVDAPAAIEPYADAGPAQRGDDLQYVLC